MNLTSIFLFCFDHPFVDHVRKSFIMEEELRENLCLVEDIQNTTDTNQVAVQCEGHELRLARESLLNFVQQNFVGCRGDLVSQLDPDVDYRHSLEVDSEQLNVNVRHPELLWSAKQHLQTLSEESVVGKSPQFLVWKMRSILVHQHVLDERTGGLYVEYKDTVQLLETTMEQLDVFVRACVTLEMVQGFILFKRVTEATQYLKKAKELLQTQLKLVSMLGFRTRFQTKPLPQLALKVITALDDLPKSGDTHASTELPRLLLLEDDTRLEKVKFVNEEFEQIMDLPSIIQCLIITEM